MAEKKTFYPSLRVFIDFLIYGNVAAFIFLMIFADTYERRLNQVLIANAAVIVLWLIVVRCLMRIELKDGRLHGPSAGWWRHSVKLREIDLTRSTSRKFGEKLAGYQDLWTVAGNRVRVYRRFFSRGQFHHLISEIEKYPFREGMSGMFAPKEYD